MNWQGWYFTYYRFHFAFLQEDNLIENELKIVIQVFDMAFVDVLGRIKGGIIEITLVITRKKKSEEIDGEIILLYNYAVQCTHRLFDKRSEGNWALILQFDICQGKQNCNFSG